MDHNLFNDRRQNQFLTRIDLNTLVIKPKNTIIKTFSPKRNFKYSKKLSEKYY